MELIIFAVLAIGLLFFMSSRTRKQQRAQQDFRSQLQVGTEVMTQSGMYGTVVEIDEVADVITLEAEPGGSRTRWLRAAIGKEVVQHVEEEPVDTDDELDETVEVPDDLSGLPGAQQGDADTERESEGADQDETSERVEVAEGDGTVQDEVVEDDATESADTVHDADTDADTDDRGETKN
ncbi:hypothetical protein GCM10025865_27790 [Paraoerskovia sediminicola]|uniref:Preprotein translocase subunit YajC n=1 Tax=Paraoerskovia sediminicola TaxID=1138587 RepID=A0ABN6XFI8_9CELL|nr:preprotein translocase subunit YajC [Paraoerskovia sediminicola]BDZ43480.1 hypothetical protein GCM10025865_27790 [Paraoerskovia sediminicola]